MRQLLSTCHRFLPDWAWGFLGAKNNFLQISRVTYSSIVHHCVNMAWVAKGSRGLPLLILHAFYRQRVLVTLQQVHAATILMWQAIITGEGSYSLSVFFSVPPLSFFLTCFLWYWGRLHDFFPLLLLAHLVDHFCFLDWTWVFSLCSLFSPSLGCFVLIKFDTVWSLDSIGFPKGLILMKLEKIPGHKQLIRK